MTNHLSGDDLSSSDDFNPEQVVTEWTEAVANLYTNYRELSAYIHQATDPDQLTEAGAMYLGQCPVNQLVDLVSAMQATLEELFLDVSQGDKAQKQTTKEQYRKLAHHTLRINQLNNQAQSRLHLLSLSSS
ncbi:hypothetical protein EXU85_23075 [Spirosoma sp. KCTC 42546]|uniref:hypothetical protein n=1 Tax=Spirosoma sp. KCTC 42546 TaxID=2520506 RepID=UPI001158CEFF|nr:hypothetical protein [Spirosoma sp. KCTC 42546]QDK81334.1 hypothetical protein EXU85_23075 [Spirosoma sp. KCTC 42546]